MEVVLAEVRGHGHSRYPVCRGSLDDVIGVLSAHRLIEPLAQGAAPVLAELMDPPVFVPETLTGMELVDHFRRNDVDMVFVVDEYGAVQGVIGERDLLEAIAGEMGEASDEDAWATQRGDGSWLMDGLIPLHELKDRLALKSLPDEDLGRYNTLAGMVMLLLGRLPATADAVEWQGWRFEVVDLDGKRVDKVLVQSIQEPETPDDHA
jgi:putative hemolysin